MGEGTKERLFTHSYILLMTVSLITSFGYSMISTLISSYAVDLGAGLTAAGALAGIFSISALVVRPFGGYASDRLDKRNLCVLATGAICLAMVGYAMTSAVEAMFLVRILHGAAFGISGTANMALVCEYAPESRLGEGLGYFGLGQVASQVMGPNVGIAVRNSLGYRPLFLMIAGMTVLAVMVLLCIPSTRQKNVEKKPPAPFRLGNLIAKECIVYALVGGVFSLGNGIVNSFLILLGEQRSIVGISLFFSVNAVVMFILRLFMGRIADKKGLSLIVNASLLTSALSMVLIGRTASFWVMMMAAALKALGQGSAQISLQSACIKRVDALRVGIAASTFYIGADIGQGLGPILGGKISVMFGYETMFYCIAGVIILAAVLFNVYQRFFLKPRAVSA